MLRDSGDNLPPDLKRDLQDEAAALRDALGRSDMSAVRSSMGRLEQTLNQAGQAAFATAGVGGYSGSNSGGESEQPGTVEGEYREV